MKRHCTGKISPGHTSPNPLVGAVVVKDNTIRGERSFQGCAFPCNDRHGFKSDETVEDVDGCTRNRTEEGLFHFPIEGKV